MRHGSGDNSLRRGLSSHGVPAPDGGWLCAIFTASIVRSGGCGPCLPIDRGQQEHDIAAECLRDRGVEVLYVMELLQDVMEYPSARAEAIIAVLSAPYLGERLRTDLDSHLAGLDPEELARVLVSGLTPEE